VRPLCQLSPGRLAVMSVIARLQGSESPSHAERGAVHTWAPSHVEHCQSMTRAPTFDRITNDACVMGGRACIRGHRICASLVAANSRRQASQ
jgi:hypothetical protein